MRLEKHKMSLISNTIYKYILNYKTREAVSEQC